MTHSVEISDAEAIAGKLTEAQRQTLLGCKTKGSTKPILLKRGLYEFRPKEQMPWAKQPRFEYHLTPLGEAVRAYLLERRS